MVFDRGDLERIARVRPGPRKLAEMPSKGLGRRKGKWDMKLFMKSFISFAVAFTGSDAIFSALDFDYHIF